MQGQSYTLARNSLLSRVFFGLFLSLVTASAGLIAGQFIPPLALNMMLFVELAMILGAVFMRRTRRIGMPFVLIFTLVSGMTMYPVIAAYSSTYGANMVLEAAGVTAVAFLVAAAVASRASFDFRFLGGLLFMGLMALILIGIASLFTGFGTTLDMAYSVLGIAVFIGYILYDVNRLTHQGATQEMVPWIVLSLYLDVLNLFLFILRLFGLNISRR